MKVNEIFYSLQGEGFHTGTASVFVRFAGCNLHCPFCDTHHEPFTELAPEDIVQRVAEFPARHVVLTGGEPALQITPHLIDLLHSEGRFVAVETNGTLALPDNLDWVTLSPKDPFLGNIAHTVLHEADELKLLFDGRHDPADYADFPVRHARFLQPVDTGNDNENRMILSKTVRYIQSHPQWRLSLQTHKYLNIP